MEPTCRTLREAFYYKDGKLLWKKAPSNNVKAGQVAGCLSSGGYSYTRLQGKLYLTHRLIFKMHYGYCPTIIDHKDLDTTNNNLLNLRGCNKSENGCNSKMPTNNTSGVKGVYLDRRSGRWVAEIKKDGVKHYVGSFVNLEDAASAIAETRRKLHKEFSNHG